MYCSHCGNALDEPEAAAEAEAADAAASAAEDVAETVSTAEVEIARINADRDITLAKIERGLVGQEIEAAAETDAVKAEVLDQIIEAEAQPDAVVVAEAPADPAPEPELDTAPPEVVETSTPEPKKGGNPFWSGFGY